MIGELAASRNLGDNKRMVSASNSVASGFIQEDVQLQRLPCLDHDFGIQVNLGPTVLDAPFCLQRLPGQRHDELRQLRLLGHGEDERSEAESAAAQVDTFVLDASVAPLRERSPALSRREKRCMVLRLSPATRLAPSNAGFLISSENSLALADGPDLQRLLSTLRNLKRSREGIGLVAILAEVVGGYFHR